MSAYKKKEVIDDILGYNHGHGFAHVVHSIGFEMSVPRNKINVLIAYDNMVELNVLLQELGVPQKVSKCELSVHCSGTLFLQKELCNASFAVEHLRSSGVDNDCLYRSLGCLGELEKSVFVHSYTNSNQLCESINFFCLDGSALEHPLPTAFSRTLDAIISIIPIDETDSSIKHVQNSICIDIDSEIGMFMVFPDEIEALTPQERSEALIKFHQSVSRYPFVYKKPFRVKDVANVLSENFDKVVQRNVLDLYNDLSAVDHELECLMDLLRMDNSWNKIILNVCWAIYFLGCAILLYSVFIGIFLILLAEGLRVAMSRPKRTEISNELLQKWKANVLNWIKQIAPYLGESTNHIE